MRSKIQFYQLLGNPWYASRQLLEKAAWRWGHHDISNSIPAIHRCAGHLTCSPSDRERSWTRESWRARPTPRRHLQQGGKRWGENRPRTNHPCLGPWAAMVAQRACPLEHEVQRPSTSTRLAPAPTPWCVCVAALVGLEMEVGCK